MWVFQWLHMGSIHKYENGTREPTGYFEECLQWRGTHSEPPTLRVWCSWESIKLMQGLSSFSCCNKPADCGYDKYIAIIFCGHSALVVFPIVFAEVGLNVIIFTWMTDHTTVIIVFWLCCFFSALFYTALPLCFCYKDPLLSNSVAPSAQCAAAHLPFRIDCHCISPYTANCSLGRSKAICCVLTDHPLRAKLLVNKAFYLIASFFRLNSLPKNKSIKKESSFNIMLLFSVEIYFLSWKHHSDSLV